MNNDYWAFCLWRGQINIYCLFHRRQKILDQQLLIAARRGQVAEVGRLLKEGANPNAPFNSTIVGEAARSHLRNPECMRLLLKHGAEVNSPHRFTIAPLIRASHSSDEECIRLLVEAGANLNIFDPHFTGAHTPLQQLIAWASLPFLQWLVSQGASIEMRGGHGQTALHIAVACDRFEVAEWLLACGADENAKDNRGTDTAIMARN